MTMDEFLKEYVKVYAFETELKESELLPNGWYVPKRFYKAIAINISSINSKVFDSVWRKECPLCMGRGSLYDDSYFLGKTCESCNRTDSIEPYDLMITFVRRNDERWNVSLYSTKEDVDCGAICQSFGGSGSKHEGRFQCKELPFEY